MSNAIKHTPSGGKVVVQVQFVRNGNARNSIGSSKTTKNSRHRKSSHADLPQNFAGGMIRIEVSDTGCGISAVSVSTSTNVITYFHGNLFL